jgi:hypothetical protein
VEEIAKTLALPTPENLSLNGPVLVDWLLSKKNNRLR